MQFLGRACSAVWMARSSVSPSAVQARISRLCIRGIGGGFRELIQQAHRQPCPPCRRKSARTMLFSVVSARRKAAHQRASKHPAIQRAVRDACFIPAPPVPRSQMPGRAAPAGCTRSIPHRKSAAASQTRRKAASNRAMPQCSPPAAIQGPASHGPGQTQPLDQRQKSACVKKGRKRKNPVPLRFLSIGFKKRAAEQRIPRKSAVAFVRSFPVPETDSPSGAGRSG